MTSSLCNVRTLMTTTPTGTHLNLSGLSPPSMESRGTTLPPLICYRLWLSNIAFSLLCNKNGEGAVSLPAAMDFSSLCKCPPGHELSITGDKPTCTQVTMSDSSMLVTID